MLLQKLVTTTKIWQNIDQISKFVEICNIFYDRHYMVFMIGENKNFLKNNDKLLNFANQYINTHTAVKYAKHT